MARRAALIALILILVSAMLLSGCGGESEGPNGPADPACGLSVQSLTFGSVNVGGSLDLIFKITNTGGGTLAGAVSEACTDFAVVGGADYSLAAGDTATITVRFSPTSVGAKACTLDTGASQCADLPCSGTGVATTPVCQASPTSLNFSNIYIGHYWDKTFTITNVGGGTLSGSVSESSDDYSIVSGGDYSLTATQSVTVTVRFTPTSVGTKTCNIETGASCAEVACTGVGDLEPVCDLSLSSIDFGSVYVGECKDTTFTITNIGGGILVGEVYATSGGFSIIGAPEFVLSVGQWATFTVRFAPTSAGPAGCTIDMDSEFCEGITCTGLGATPPVCEVEPEVLDFGDVEVGESADLTFYVRNAGGPSFLGTVSSLCSGFTIVGDDSYNLDSGELEEFTVRFAPASVGAKACTLDTGVSQCANLPCGGTGIVTTPVCQISPTSLSFDVVLTGSYADRVFTITNVGSGTLSGSVSESSDEYSIVSGGGEYNLSASQSVVVTVRFAPTSEGDKICTVATGGSCPGVYCTGVGTVEPVCDLSVSSLDFGTVMIGAEKDTTFTITNTGGWWLVGWAYTSCADMWIVDGGEFELGADESATFTVRYAPSSAGPAECTIFLDSGYCGDIGCTGVGAVGPLCDVNPDTLDFGFLEVGGGSVDLTFTLRNIFGGTMSGTVSSPCAEFSIVGSGAYSLGQGDSATFTVRFSPADLGAEACMIETGSGTCVDVAATGGGAPHGDYYVHASSGSDTNPGTIRAPFKTITYAVSAAGPNKTLCVLPGTYDAALGEVFPIALEQGQVLLGDVEGKGTGVVATTVYGAGYAGDLPWSGILAALLPADGSSIAGFSFDAPLSYSTFSLYVEDATCSIADNTFGSPAMNLYGGVCAFGSSVPNVVDNDFLTNSYGVYNYQHTGTMTIESNLFETMAICIDIAGYWDSTWIQGNTFVGSGQCGMQVQSGYPLIENNTFNNPGGYPEYGAITCGSSDANPTVRGNVFTCARGVRVESANPDLGTAGDPGGNDFSGVTGAAVYHMGSSSVTAIGNTWASSPPNCGAEIVITGTGTVTWGEGAGESCP